MQTSVESQQGSARTSVVSDTTEMRLDELKRLEASRRAEADDHRKKGTILVTVTVVSYFFWGGYLGILGSALALVLLNEAAKEFSIGKRLLIPNAILLMERDK